MYLSTESTILPPETKTFNIKGVLIFILLDVMTVNTEQQDSVAAGKYILD